MSEVKARVSVHLKLVTAQRELEESHTQVLRGQKLEAIGQLAAGVAHEINTPTQYVSDNTRFLQESFAEIVTLLDLVRRNAQSTGEGSADGRLEEIAAALKKSDLDYLLEEIPKALAQSIQGLARIAEIVRSMKEFSHPGAKDKAPTDIHRGIESTVTVARNEWKYVADVTTSFDPELPNVTCCLGDLNQVILNLIVNASHAIAEKNAATPQVKGVITISTRRDGEWVEIRVMDTGCGIPAEIASKVFDPFFTTKAVGKGTGQGLAIAHAVVVDLHGGSLALESRPGEGTTFVIRIPIQPEALSVPV